MEAEDFEENFLRQKSKMPKSYLLKKNLSLPPVTLAMIFSLHYIILKKAESKSVKQSLAKNASFKAFAVKMPEVIAALTALGVLITERRMVPFFSAKTACFGPIWSIGSFPVTFPDHASFQDPA